MFSENNFFPLQSREFFGDSTSLHRLFGETARPIFRGSLGRMPTERMASDFESLETDDHFLLAVEMPGVSKDSLNVEVTDGCLKIAGEREASWVAAGRSGSSETIRIERVFALPSSVDTNRIEGNYQNGILKLVMPKTEQARPRKIVIGESKNSLWSKLTQRIEKRAESSAESTNELRHN